MNKNKIDFSNMSTGKQNVRYGTDRKSVEVEPMKVTGDIKEEKLPDPGGVAKASPKFEEIEPDEEQTEEEKKKSVAEKTEKIEE